MADLLEQLWVEVINIDPAGKWVERSSKNLGPLKKQYAQCAPALQRLIKLGSAQDVGQVSRFCRYEACFGILYALDDPGLPKRTSLQPQPLIEAALNGTKPSNKMAAFIESLKEMLSLDDDGEWLLELAKDKNKWTQDVSAALKRLIKAGASVEDLAQLSIWSTYEGCVGTFRLLHEAKLQIPDDTTGLYESLQSADPSGKEGGAGSWPLATSKPKSKSTCGPGELWRIRSGQAVAFSPDSKTLAVGGASGPVRLYDALTGKELLICEGIKAHIYRVAFSPDGKRLAVADINKRLDICDARTGKVLAKATFPEEEISGLEFSAKNGDLLRSAWKVEIDVVDGWTGKKKEPLCASAKTNSVNALQLCRDGSTVMVASRAAGKSNAFEGTLISIWSWPDRQTLSTFEVPQSFLRGYAISPGGSVVAVSQPAAFDNKTVCVSLIDSDSGKIIQRLPAKRPGSLAFHPDGRLFVADEEHLLIFEPVAWKQTDEITGVNPFEIAISPDGKLLAVTTCPGVRVWRL